MLKNSSFIKGCKTIGGAMASIGGAAVIGCLLKKSDLSSIRGIKKLCIGAGIFGLAHAAGHFAEAAVKDEIDQTVEAADLVQTMFASAEEAETEDEDLDEILDAEVEPV